MKHALVADKKECSVQGVPHIVASDNSFGPVCMMGNTLTNLLVLVLKSVFAGVGVRDCAEATEL